MNYIGVPIIVVCCYMVGEIYKVIYKKKEELYKLIPIVLSIMGGTMGICIYLTNPEVIFNVDNVWVALGIGIVSGVSATGSNQIIKQIFSKGDK